MTARALDYSRKRWRALSRFLDDGNVAFDNNYLKNQIRPWAVGRKGWLFAGSELAGQRAATVMSLIVVSVIVALAVIWKWTSYGPHHDGLHKGLLGPEYAPPADPGTIKFSHLAHMMPGQNKKPGGKPLWTWGQLSEADKVRTKDNDINS